MFKAIKFDGTDEEINQQWLERRKHGIGGSDAAAILGLNKYATQYTVWLEKTNRAEPDDLSDNEKVYWGTVLEPVIANEFAKRHPEFYITEPGAMYQSEEYPWMLASVDRVINVEQGRKKTEGGSWVFTTPGAILEVKTVGERRRADWDDGVPDYYLAQVIHYLAVTGFDTAYVAVLIAGQEYREYTIDRDQDDVDYLIEKEKEFWGYVERDEVPPAMGGHAEAEAIIEQYPVADDLFLKMLDDDVPQVGQYMEIGEKIKELQAEKERLNNDVKLLIGDHLGIETPRYKIKWSRSDYERFDSKKFQKENPDLYMKYLKTSKRDNGLRISII